MIIYLDRERGNGNAPSQPPWLDGWTPKGVDVALCGRSTEGGMLSGVGSPIVFGPPARVSMWREIDSRWCAFLSGALEVENLRRDQFVYDLIPVEDLTRRVWMAPRVLMPDGARSFRVNYGKDWLPELSESQVRAEQIAEAARDALTGQGGVDMKIACQWAAELLCETHHLSPETIAALGLMDDTLALGTLAAATSLPLARAEA